MKKELEYFMIDGEFGGNQDWFTNIVMNVGGCGAATACDSCIYLAKYKGMKKLYPFDLEQMDKEAYKKFSQIMKLYIRPRVQGVKKPEWYIEGLAKYISDVNEKYGTDYQIDMEKFDGTGTAEEAEKIICEQIDKGLPVDRSSCPYNTERLKDRKYIKSNMLTNPFEKFERKRFLYYSKDLNVISMNHALFIKMSKHDFEKVKVQMEEDLEKYYERVK